MNSPRLAATAEAPGLAARRAAAELLNGVLRRHRPLDEQLDSAFGNAAVVRLPERDRALARNIVATALRRLGTLRHILASCLDHGLPREAPKVEAALLVGATQILFLDVADHAAVDLAVRLVQADSRARRYAALVNAVLRRIARGGAAQLANLDALVLDTPAWLMTRWTRSYGEANARTIALAHAHEPALDLTVKSGPEHWAERLGGRLLPTGSVRVIAHGPISQLPGFAEGAWWVQDAAAALPARLFGDMRGLRIADLCAAPGGKTAQLAAAGAQVTAVDRSERRLARLRDNLQRLGLDAECIAADATAWRAGPFDGVLVDAPCSATGTIRRHPDIAWLKREEDLAPLAAQQRRLLGHAIDLVKPGGTLIYCTCSLEPEEGEEIVASVLAGTARVRRWPIAADEISGRAELLTPVGDLRTLPCHWPDPEPRLAGLDGFYAARLQRV